MATSLAYQVQQLEHMTPSRGTSASRLRVENSRSTVGMLASIFDHVADAALAPITDPIPQAANTSIPSALVTNTAPKAVPGQQSAFKRAAGPGLMNGPKPTDIF